MTSFVRLSLLATSILASSPVLAADAASAAAQIPASQSDPNGSTSAGTGQSDNGEIVVTARHRNESAQSVPVAISVVGGDHIDSTGAFNVGRLQQLTPTLQFYSSNPRNTSVNIRGFGAPLGLTNDGIDQGVGIYVDDVYYSRVASSTFDFLDVAQIEVLRGPQGTLYGKNTTAGAINITSRAPTFEPEARAEVSGGNYGYFQFKGAVSGPLSDNLAIRLAVSETKRAGTIDNITTGVKDNNQNNTGFRGQVLWKPTSNLEVTLAGDWNHQNIRCCATVFVGYVPTQKAVNRQYPALSAAQGYSLPAAAQDPANRLTDIDSPIYAKQSIGGASLKAKLDVGFGTITSITAWRFWDWNPSNDRDFTGLPITTISQNPSKQHQFTQELRFNHHGEKLDFQVGTFYYYNKVSTDGSQVQGSAATKWLVTPPTTANNTPTNPYNLGVINGLTSTNTIRSSNNSWSVYAQASWHPFPGLTLQPGIRVNYDKKQGSYNAVVTDASGNVLTAGELSTGTAIQKAQLGVLIPESYAASIAKWSVSYDFTVAYDVTPNIHTYATYSKSFQTGGLNLNGVPADAATGLPQSDTFVVKPESVKSYEIGIKSQFFDRRATLNLAAFRTDIGNYQAIFSANNPNSVSALRGYIANVQAVRSQGIEADFSARPSERFNTYLNFAYTDATYRKFTNAPPPLELSGGSSFVGTNCAIPTTTLLPNQSPVSCDISGQALPGVSKYSLSFGAEANVPLRAGGKDGEVYVGVDGNYRSKFSSNATPSASTEIPGYTLTNFRLGWRSPRDATGLGINVFGWVRNAFNTTYFEQYQIAPNSVGLLVGNIGDPRTYGATVQLQF
jgi:iron complex outermembrane receptor protein